MNAKKNFNNSLLSHDFKSNFGSIVDGGKFLKLKLSLLIVLLVIMCSCKNSLGSDAGATGTNGGIPGIPGIPGAGGGVPGVTSYMNETGGSGYRGDITYGNTAITPATTSGNKLFTGSPQANRIPTLLALQDGSLLAFADKRYGGSGDLPNRIEVFVRKSTNNGTNWSTEQIITPISSSKTDGHGDAAAVQDRKTGDIIAVVAAESGFLKSTPEAPIRIKTIRSKDGGNSWENAIDITPQIYGAQCTDTTRRTWQGAFAASGNGLQLRNGRICFVITVRETAAATQAEWKNYLIYSDDGGHNWKVSSGYPKNAKGGNEAKVVELNQDGHLLMSIRPNSAPWVRSLARSTDYGETWSEAKEQNDLPSSGSNGDMIYYTSTENGYDKNRLITVFDARPYSSGNNGGPGLPTFYISYDEGVTWKSKQIYNGNAGYSSIAILKDGSIGILAELTQSWNGPIWFFNTSVEWLDANDHPTKIN